MEITFHNMANVELFLTIGHRYIASTFYIFTFVILLHVDTLNFKCLHLYFQLGISSKVKIQMYKLQKKMYFIS